MPSTGGRTCDTCVYGQPNIVWVRYPDNALRRMDVVVCVKGMPTAAPATPPPWVNFPLPRNVKKPKDECKDWSA